MTDPTTPQYVAPADTVPSWSDIKAEVTEDAKTLTDEVKADAKEALSDLLKFSRVPTEELARGIAAKLHAFIDAL